MTLLAIDDIMRGVAKCRPSVGEYLKNFITVSWFAFSICYGYTGMYGVQLPEDTEFLKDL